MYLYFQLLILYNLKYKKIIIRVQVEIHLNTKKTNY